MGTYTSHFLTKGGGIIIGIQEYNCSLQNPNGINVDDLIKYRDQEKTIEVSLGVFYDSTVFIKLRNFNERMKALSHKYKELILHV